MQVYGFSDKGSVRPTNEDYFGYFIPTEAKVKDKRGSLFAVSDGVGGSASGEVASAEAVNAHPNRNVLLKAIGEGPLLLPDFYSGQVKPGDLFCLITDGILEHATDEDLKAFLLEKRPSQERLSQWIAELNRRGGYDNMTILTVKVNQVPC